MFLHVRHVEVWLFFQVSLKLVPLSTTCLLASCSLSVSHLQVHSKTKPRLRAVQRIYSKGLSLCA